MGILAAFNIKLSQSHSGDSPFFAKFKYPQIVRKTGVIIWLLAITGFVCAALAILDWTVPFALWQFSALLGLFASVFGLIFYWNAFPFFFPNKVGVIVVDLIIFISIYRIHWPPELFQ